MYLPLAAHFPLCLWFWEACEARLHPRAAATPFVVLRVSVVAQDFMGKLFLKFKLNPKIKLFYISILWWLFFVQESFFFGTQNTFIRLRKYIDFVWIHLFWFSDGGSERKEYQQESNKKQTLNGDKTHTRCAIWASLLVGFVKCIKASCGVRINYDKVIRKCLGVLSQRFRCVSILFWALCSIPPFRHTLMVVY